MPVGKKYIAAVQMCVHQCDLWMWYQLVTLETLKLQTLLPRHDINNRENTSCGAFCFYWTNGILYHCSWDFVTDYLAVSLLKVLAHICDICKWRYTIHLLSMWTLSNALAQLTIYYIHGHIFVYILHFSPHKRMTICLKTSFIYKSMQVIAY